MAGETPQLINKVYMWLAFIIQLKLYLLCTSLIQFVLQSTGALLNYFMTIDSIYCMMICLTLAPLCYQYIAV